MHLFLWNTTRSLVCLDWCHWRFIPIFFPLALSLNFAGVFPPLQSKDKESVDSVQKNEERLRAVLQGSSLGFLETNSRLLITNVNAAVCFWFFWCLCGELPLASREEGNDDLMCNVCGYPCVSQAEALFSTKAANLINMDLGSLFVDNEFCRLDISFFVYV